MRRTGKLVSPSLSSIGETDETCDSVRLEFVVTLRANPGVDPVIAIRLALKAARRYGLRCTAIVEKR
jgi:hypothetical protein